MSLNISILAKQNNCSEKEFKRKIDGILSQENDYFQSVDRILHYPSVMERIFSNIAVKRAEAIYDEAENLKKEWKKLTGYIFPLLITDENVCINYYYYKQNMQ